MNYKLLLLFQVLLLVSLAITTSAQHEDIPYQNVANICQTCTCEMARGELGQRSRNILNCSLRNFTHILARWPENFGTNHNGINIEAIFSGNNITVLQQLPATNAQLSFSCRNCGIRQLQSPTFMDVPNIKSLDLSWNAITTDELASNHFRGPFRATVYEPIALVVLDLSHNLLYSLDKRLFQHTPNLTKLDLSHNKFDVLDGPTIWALTSASNLQILDLSHTNLKALSSTIFRDLINLKSLNLAGNSFAAIPDNLQLVGKTLESLNLAENKITQFTEQSFLGLKVLKRLNISSIALLKSIAKGTFTRLETLEYLYCSHNPGLREFDLDSLMHCSNLTLLDISYCGISALSIDMDLSQTIDPNRTEASLPEPWPKLRVFKTAGNPWLCDCELMKTLEFAGSHHRSNVVETRCDSPYIFAGARLSNLTAVQICNMQIPKKYLAINEDPPRFLRKRYIILTAITVSVVVMLGLLIGFLVVCIRRRLKRDDYGIEPIRYMSVRNENRQAFSLQRHTSAAGSNAQ